MGKKRAKVERTGSKHASVTALPFYVSSNFLRVNGFQYSICSSASNFSHISCFFILDSFGISKFKELEFADIVSSAIPLSPEEESDWVSFQSKKEKS